MAFGKVRTFITASLTALALAGCGGAGSSDGTKEQAVINKVTAPAGKAWSLSLIHI